MIDDNSDDGRSVHRTNQFNKKVLYLESLFRGQSKIKKDLGWTIGKQAVQHVGQNIMTKVEAKKIENNVGNELQQQYQQQKRRGLIVTRNNAPEHNRIDIQVQPPKPKAKQFVSHGIQTDEQEVFSLPAKQNFINKKRSVQVDTHDLKLPPINTSAGRPKDAPTVDEFASVKSMIRSGGDRQQYFRIHKPLDPKFHQSPPQTLSKPRPHN